MAVKKIQTDVFWKALVLTTIVFLLGIFVGYLLEVNNLSNVKESYLTAEIDLIDIELQSRYYDVVAPSEEFCEAAIQENLEYADEFYEFGLRLDRLEDENKLTQVVLLDKKKYVLSKLRFWFNSIELKKECNADFHNIVYFYYQFPDVKTESKQQAQSEVLRLIKEEYGNKVMLIPIAIDLELLSVDLIKEQYGINTIPTILIDEKTVLEDLQSEEDIEVYIN